MAAESASNNKFILKLDGEEKENYLNKISDCLGFLSFNNFLGISKDLKKILTFINFYKYNCKEGIYEELIIDPRSGFPNIMEYIKLASLKSKIHDKTKEIILQIDKDYKFSNEGVGELIDRGKDILLKEIKRKIYSVYDHDLTEYLKTEQKIYKTLKYLSQLSSLDSFVTLKEEFKKEYTIISEYDDFKSYKLKLTGYDSTKNLFSIYLLDLFIKNKNDIIDGDGINRTFSIKLDNLSGNEPSIFLNELSKNKCIIPKNITRIVLGPFYSKYSLEKNIPPMNDSSFLFRIYKEKSTNNIDVISFPVDINIFQRIINRKINKKHTKINSEPRKEYLLCSSDVFDVVSKTFSMNPNYEIMEFKKFGEGASNEGRLHHYNLSLEKMIE